MVTMYDTDHPSLIIMAILSNLLSIGCESVKALVNYALISEGRLTYQW